MGYCSDKQGLNYLERDVYLAKDCFELRLGGHNTEPVEYLKSATY